jgi:N-acetylglucosaminyldiphosphoundecaprenol N-acetyl-beta-D-mannosaminyltransferase
MMTFNKIFLLGVGFSDINEHEVLEYIITGLPNQSKKYYIVTPNPELLVMASNDKNYQRVLNDAKLALSDGIGVMIAGKVMGKPLKERIHGVDLVKSLCKEISRQPITVGFLGAGPSVAEKASECLKREYPGLKVGLVSQEWSESLKNRPVDILFVAFGSPKQEIWISENLEKLPAKVVIGVGGAFDFISGKVRRAPLFMRKIGLEWLFRLIIQPWRIKRQLRLIQFIFLVFKAKFNLK